MCGLGQTASNPVLSTLNYFMEEYRRHVLDKKCDAFVCKDLVGASCQAACPLDTEVWRYVALIEKGEYEQAYKVIRHSNPFPSACAEGAELRSRSRASTIAAVTPGPCPPRPSRLPLPPLIELVVCPSARASGASRILSTNMTALTPNAVWIMIRNPRTASA